MRKVLYIVGMLVLIVGACSKSDSGLSNGNSYEKLLQGTWHVESTNYIYYVDGDQVFNEAEENDVIYTFKNGEIFTSAGNGTYVIDGKERTITLRAKDDQQKYKISSLDENTMILKARITPEFYYDGPDKHNADYSDMTMVLQKNN